MTLSTAVSLWGPVVFLMALIFSASSLPDPGPLPGDLSDKAAHFAVYALLGATLLRALARGRVSDITAARIAAAVALSALYGATDELHQIMVPGRTPDWQDVLADALGALAGALALVAVWRWLMRGRAVERYTRSE